jgi:hypothetical protein
MCRTNLQPSGAKKKFPNGVQVREFMYKIVACKTAENSNAISTATVI